MFVMIYVMIMHTGTNDVKMLDYPTVSVQQ